MKMWLQKFDVIYMQRRPEYQILYYKYCLNLAVKFGVNLGLLNQINEEDSDEDSSRWLSHTD
jgi:hypothetical protein